MVAISVVVPVYNEEVHIIETIKCLKKQTFNDFECILVNDCSTDNTKNVIAQNIKNDSRFFCVDNKINIRLSATRNVGLFYARGEYVVFLDSDDILTTTALAERYKVAKENSLPWVAGSYGKHRTIGENEKIYPESTKLTSCILSFQQTMGDNPVVIHSPMIKKDIAIGINGFSEYLKEGAEDYDFWIKLLRHGFILVPTNLLDCFYRQKNNSMIRACSKQHLEVALSIFKKSTSYLDKGDFFSIAYHKMCFPVHMYKNEEILFIRITKFLGMTIASNPEEIDFESISKLLPNFYMGFPFHLSAIDSIRSGMQRSLFGINNIAIGDFDVKIATILNKITELTKKENFLLNKKDNIFESNSNKWSFDFVFIPHKDYHVYIIKSIYNHLNKLGIRIIVADCTAMYKDEGVQRALHETSLPSISLPLVTFGDFSTQGVIVFNDWDTTVTRPAIKSAQRAGILDIAIVEGIQDYNDADTGRLRYPYKTAKNVILPCPFDKKYFNPDETHLYVSGMPRIADLNLLSKNVSFKKNAPIVINVNFTYGVLEEKRDQWIKEAVEVCNELKIDYVISRHPADFGNLWKYNISKKNMYDTILEGSILISRFSTSIIEAIAMNRPVIYFNPHNEQVDKFKNPNGAYFIAVSKEELKSAIIDTFNNINEISKKWPDFLKEHAGFDASFPLNASKKMAEALKEMLDRHKQKKSDKSPNAFGNIYRNFIQNSTLVHQNDLLRKIYNCYERDNFDEIFYIIDCFQCKKTNINQKIIFYTQLFDRFVFLPIKCEQQYNFMKLIYENLILFQSKFNIKESLLIFYYKYINHHGDFLEHIKKSLYLAELEYFKIRPDVKRAINDKLFSCALEHYVLHGKLEEMVWPEKEIFVKVFRNININENNKTTINRLDLKHLDYIKEAFIEN